MLSIKELSQEIQRVESELEATRERRSVKRRAARGARLKMRREYIDRMIKEGELDREIKELRLANEEKLRDYSYYKEPEYCEKGGNIIYYKRDGSKSGYGIILTRVECMMRIMSVVTRRSWLVKESEVYIFYKSQGERSEGITGEVKDKIKKIYKKRYII